MMRSLLAQLLLAYRDFDLRTVQQMQHLNYDDMRTWFFREGGNVTSVTASMVVNTRLATYLGLACLGKVTAAHK